MTMLSPILILNLLVSGSFSQPDSCFLAGGRCGTTKTLLPTSLSPEKPSHEMSDAPFQAQATVDFQVDGLDGSAVINLTRAAGSGVVALTSGSKSSRYLSPSPTKAVALTDQGVSYPANCSTIFVPSTGSVVSTFPSQTANSSQSFNTSTLHSPPLTSTKSANVSVCTGSGVPFSQDLLDPAAVLIFGLTQLAITFLL